MKRRLLVIGLVLLLALPLVLLLKDWTRHVLLVELLRIVWAMRIFFLSLPQIPMWTLFLIIVLVIAVRSLLRQQALGPQKSRIVIKRQGPVELLSSHIQRAAEGEYFRWSLAHELRALILEVLAHQRRTTPDQMRQLAEAGLLDAPPEIQDFLYMGLSPIYTLSSGLLTRLKRRLMAGLRVVPVRKKASDPELEQVVAFLERLLEV